MKKKYVKPSSTVYPVLLQSIMAEQSGEPDGQNTIDSTITGKKSLMNPSATGTGASSSICTNDVPDVWE
jgi:hypothetical protein